MNQRCISVSLQVYLVRSEMGRLGHLAFVKYSLALVVTLPVKGDHVIPRRSSRVANSI